MESYSYGNAPWYSYRETIVSIVIGSNVSSIGDFAFVGIASVESIRIPDSVISIGISAFSDCSSLSSIIIPDSVRFIGASAFEGCAGLATMNLGKSVRFIGASAFKDCTALVSFVVSDDNRTFSSTDGVLFSKDKAIAVQYPVSETDASYEMHVVTETILVQYPAAKEGTSYKIPDNVTTIGSSAFEGCTTLISITVPDSVTSIKSGAFDTVFYDTDGETELEPTADNLAGSTFNKVDDKWIRQAIAPVADPNRVSGECGEGVTYELDLSARALSIRGSGKMYSYSEGEAPWFPYIDSIRSVEIADAVTSIGDFAFEGCTNLATVNLGGSVSLLGISAFKDCTGLKELTVPASLDCVGSNDNPGFAGCVNIEKFTFTKGDGTWYSYDTGSSQTVSPINGSGTLNDDAPGHLSEQSDYRYTPWQLSRSVLTSVIVSDGVTSIGDSAFKGCSAINSLILGNTVVAIGDSAFSDCTSLASVTIPDSVGSIGGSAFRGCISLISISLPDSVGSIGESAFEDCKSLSSVTLPDSVESVGESVFSGCDSLSAFRVSEESSKYCSINGVLYNNSRTELIRYPAGNTDTSFEIPFGVTSIGARAFWDNTYLTSITIPDSVNTFGEGAFNATFYDTDGETLLEQPTVDLAGFTFDKIDDKWIKQSSALLPSPSPEGTIDEGPEIMYLLVTILSAIALLVALEFMRKKNV